MVRLAGLEPAFWEFSWLLIVAFQFTCLLVVLHSKAFKNKLNVALVSN